MVHYNQFATTDDVAYNISNALSYCKEHREDRLVFDKGCYRIKNALASEHFYSISNHGDPGLKRVCFLIEGMSDFTIDGNGSHFIFEDIMIPVAVDHSQNITFQNFSFESENTQNCQAKVVDSKEGWILLEVQTKGEKGYAGKPCCRKDWKWLQEAA